MIFTLLYVSELSFLEKFRNFVEQNCQTKLSNKVVEQSCRTKLSNKIVEQNCRTKLSNKIVRQIAKMFTFDLFALSRPAFDVSQ